MSESTKLLSPRPAAHAVADDHVRQLRRLWREGQRPDIQAFLSAVGPLGVWQVLTLLRIDQRERWQTGERVPLENYRQLHPPLRDGTEHFLDLVYGEFLLREQLGEAPNLKEYEARYPELAEELRLQIEVHRLVAPDSTTGVRADVGVSLPKIAGYRLVGQLGRGGMAVVFRAWQEGLERLVALKMIDGHGRFDPEQRARFRAEAVMAAGLRHPNIVQVYEVGEQDGWPFFSMELVEGGSLAERFRGQPQPARPAAAFLATLARAVDHAHRLGIVHRDLKPANVLLSRRGVCAEPHGEDLEAWEPKIADFGLAKYLEAGEGRTHSGAILGTPNYMAPEQAAGRSRDIGPTTDVYALGAILYELITGRPPFVGVTALETMDQVRTQEPVPPSQLNPRLPRDLTTICLKCLEKEPARRYASAGELADELDRFVQHRPIRARRVGPGARLARWCRRNPVPAALTLAVALALLLGTAGSSYFALEAGEQAQEALAQAETAQKNERLARSEKQTADRRLYIADLLQAQHAWQQSQVGHLQFLLDRQRPEQTGGIDLRGFEWHYWNRLAQGSQFVYRGHSSWVYSTAFSPDGRWLASGGTDGIIRIWEAATGRTLHTLQGHRPDRRGWVTVAFSPDGRRLASAGYDGIVRLWDAIEGRSLAVCRGHEGRVYSVAFSPDGQQLASGGDGGIARLWEVPTGREQHVLHGLELSGFHAVAYHPTKRWLAAGGSHGTMFIWDPVEGKELRKVDCPELSIYSLAFRPDGHRLAVGNGDGMVRLWDPDSGKWAEQFAGHSNRVLSVAYSHDGRLASSGLDQTIRIWDPVAGRPPRILRGHTAVVWSVAFSPDGEHLASASEDQTVRLWGPDEGAEFVSLPARCPGESGAGISAVEGHIVQSNAVAYSANGRRLATCGDDRTVKVRDARTGEILHSLSGHAAWVAGLAFSPDSTRLASASHDGKVRLWDPANGRLLHTLTGHTDRAYSVAFHPDGRLLASAGADRLVRLWDVATGQQTGTLAGHDDTVFQVAFSPDGQRLATASRDETVKVWDAASGRLLLTFSGHERVYKGIKAIWGSAGYGLAFSPDSRFIASAVLDRRVLVWEAATGRVRYTFQGHSGLVNGVAFHRDGTRLASAGEDRTIKLWDMGTGQETLTLRGHPRPVLCVAFSPNGQHLVSGDDFWCVRLWDASP